MGCCMSTQQASSSSSPCQPPPKRRRLEDPIEESLDKAKDDTRSEKTTPKPSPSPSPLPPLPLLYVEEKVKGVLIETPFSNPNPISIVKPPQNQTLHRPKPKPYKTTAFSNNAGQKWSTKTTPPSPPQQPPRNLLSTSSMSPARSAPKRERVAGQSPTRKPGFLHPGRVNGGLVKMVQSREPGAVVSTKTDPVLGPWKRAGSSPVARVSNNGAGRSPVAERGSGATGRRNTSPGRVRRDPTRKGKGQALNGQVDGKESLESPLVSLECFIFL